MSSVPASQTTTSSELPPVVKQTRDLVDGDFTFVIAHQPEDFLKSINADLEEEHEIEGEVTGVTSGKVIVDTEDGHKSFGHEYWLHRYGCQAVDDVSYDGEKIRGTLFGQHKLQRKVVNWTKLNCGHDIYMELLVNDDDLAFFKNFVDIAEDYTEKELEESLDFGRFPFQ
jgi:hypothetical protein